MELATGVEPRNEFLAIELGLACRKYVEEVNPIQPGEQVLIGADTMSDWRVVTGLAQAVYAVGATPTVVWYETRPDSAMEPPAPMAAAMKAANAYISVTSRYLLYSNAWEESINAGCRYLSCSGMDADMMVRMIGQVNHTALNKFRAKLTELSLKAQRLHVTAPAGTDVWMDVDPAGFPIALEEIPGKGYTKPLPGQLAVGVALASINGRIVFDGALWPPADIGVLRHPVVLTVEQGEITRVEGDAEARIFDRWLSKFNTRAMYKIAHWCYGFNPGITRISGRINEDERVWGSVEFGIGPRWLGAPRHTDGIILDASVWADEVQVEDEGRYVHPELMERCKELGIPGY